MSQTSGSAADRRRPTLRDVAARADVSFKTVSRVVNGESGVSAALIERVQSAIAELDFRPDPGARSLRAGGRTQAIGILLEDVANPYSAAVLRAVEDTSRSRGVMVFSASLDEDAERERHLVRAFGTRRVDGLILAPSGPDQSYVAGEIASGTSVVCVDRVPQGIDVDAVVSTDLDGARIGVEHLIEGGHRKIAFLGERQSIPTAQLRFRGFQETCAAHGLQIPDEWITHQLHDVEGAERATRHLLESDRRPTAIFSAQNLITIGALRALREFSLEHSIALVGFDDFPLADMMNPGVTVVAQNPAIIGATAANLLFQRIDGSAEAPKLHHVPTTLIRRGSGEVPPPR